MVVEDKILKCDIPRLPLPEVPFPDYILGKLNSFDEDTASKVWLTDWSTKKRVKFNELSSIVTRLTAGLQQRCFQPGTVVCMYASNHVEYPLITLASWKLKGIVTGLPITTLPDQLAERCNYCEAKIICCDLKRANNALQAMQKTKTVKEIWLIDGKLEGCVPFSELLVEVRNTSENDEAACDPNLDDLLWLPFSSGTTGLPKGIMHTHKTLLSMVTMGSSRSRQGLSNGSYLYINSMSHIAGLGAAFSGMAGGMEAITLSELSDIAFIEAIAEAKPSIVMAYPTQMAWMLRDPIVKQYDLGSVEVFSIGGSTWNADDEPGIFRVFPNLKNFITGYGMTEVGYISSTLARRTPPINGIQERKRNTSGWVLPGVSLKVVDSITGQILGAGQEGAVWVQTPTMMQGYWQNTKATTEIFQGGWAFTGDQGYYDNDEEVFITGRLKELIKYRAAHVYPVRVENVLCSIEGVVDACVVGIPHNIDGQLPSAAIVLGRGADISREDIQEIANKRLCDEENLRGGVFIVKRIPYNENGKPLRRQVLEEILSREV